MRHSSRVRACVSLLAGVLAACSGPAGQEPFVSAEPTGSADTVPAAFHLPPVARGTAPENPYSAEQIVRGRYLVEIGSCHDCHTPSVFDPTLGVPVMDMSRALSGHPRGAPGPQGTLGPQDSAIFGPTFTSFRLPFGTTYSANLTPDIDTGTGSWTEAMFLSVFRTGRHMGGNGRGVMPPMPWLNIRSMTDDDLVAVFAYLRSLPPVRNAVPNPDVPDAVIWALRDSFDRLLLAQGPGGAVPAQ